MSLIHRIAIGLKGERKDAATALITRGQQKQDRAHNRQMAADIQGRLGAADAGDPTAAWQVDMSQMTVFTGE